jgi:GTPase SAR1 family protein
VLGSLALFYPRSFGFFQTTIFHQMVIFSHLSSYHLAAVSFSGHIMIDGNGIILEVCNASGREDSTNRELLYSQTDVFLLCFSVMSPASFDSTSSRWLPEILHHCPNSKIILVGTRQNDHGSDVIRYEQGLEKANQIKAVKYIECSYPREQGSCIILFEEAVRSVLVTKQPKKKRSCILL